MMQAVRRRIDVTFENLDASLARATEYERLALSETKTFAILQLISRLRGMELAEQEVRGGPLPDDLADTYDRVAQAGEPAHAALLRTYKAYFRKAWAATA
jgi:hypothetical protein